MGWVEDFLRSKCRMRTRGGHASGQEASSAIRPLPEQEHLGTRQFFGSQQLVRTVPMSITWRGGMRFVVRMCRAMTFRIGIGIARVSKVSSLIASQQFAGPEATSVRGNRSDCQHGQKANRGHVLQHNGLMLPQSAISDLVKQLQRGSPISQTDFRRIQPTNSVADSAPEFFLIPAPQDGGYAVAGPGAFYRILPHVLSPCSAGRTCVHTSGALVQRRPYCRTRVIEL